MLDITICKNRDNEKYSLRNDKYEFWTGAYQIGKNAKDFEISIYEIESLEEIELLKTEILENN